MYILMMIILLSRFWLFENYTGKVLHVLSNGAILKEQFTICRDSGIMINLFNVNSRFVWIGLFSLVTLSDLALTTHPIISLCSDILFVSQRIHYHVLYVYETLFSSLIVVHFIIVDIALIKQIESISDIVTSCLWDLLQLFLDVK